ncbi:MULTISPECIES: hypothetical protein [unclassified Sphingobium]|uniref:hypothetical protein n=1 Tax=unclassified Sphingobium TaxID=2611147 RepID=UPI00222527EA|nr:MULTISPECIES: hypothetical protein [unclassified Sphingobium]MCW2395888.1 hypothetical protein [Sphingobium sp. B8D3B]MCW2419404.1 hypothetical protein [Sphingobium sp. B8D3C]
MSGVHIIGTLLRGYDDLTALIPAAQIKAGKLPDGTVRGLLLRSVSNTENQTLTREATIRKRARVSVTLRTQEYRDFDLIMPLIVKACAGLTGQIAGHMRVSILTAGEGPDVLGPASTFERTQDFRVSYDAQT